MRKLKEIAFGFEAIEYIKYILENGKTLSNCLLQNCDLDSGRVITYLPIYVNEEEAKEFKFGGKIKVSPESIIYKPGVIAVPIPNTNDCLIKIIQDFLDNGDGNLCIFEDATRNPTDPVISLKDTRIFICQNEVYYVLFSKDAGAKDRIDDTIWDSDSHWHFVCVMTSAPKDSCFFRNQKNINANDLKTLAERAEKVAIGAYDGEGYLIWSRE